MNKTNKNIDLLYLLYDYKLINKMDKTNKSIDLLYLLYDLFKTLHT